MPDNNDIPEANVFTQPRRQRFVKLPNSLHDRLVEEGRSAGRKINDQFIFILAERYGMLEEGK